jgi:hypothetical protein
MNEEMDSPTEVVEEEEAEQEEEEADEDVPQEKN